MLKVDGAEITSGKSMLVVLCLALGTMVGELIGIENDFESIGEWLKNQAGLPDHDTHGGGLSVTDRFYSELLHRNQSCLGEEIKSRQHASGGAVSNSGGLSAVEFLREICPIGTGRQTGLFPETFSKMAHLRKSHFGSDVFYQLIRIL